MGAIVGKSRELGVNSEDNQLLRISKSGRLPTIEYAHLAVHEDVFAVHSEYVADLDVARDYYIKPITGYEWHSVFLVKASSACRVQIYEGTTVSSPGTVLPYMRNNRNSVKVGLQNTYHTPTLTLPGTLIHDTYTGGNDATGIRTGGESRQGEELVLKTAVGYRVVVTPVVANTIMSFSHEYYEVPA